MAEPAPLWIVFPDLGVTEPTSQGDVEAYIELEWWPFWSGLERAAKDDYLDRWNASPEWRAAIAERYDQQLDVEQDAKESAAWLAARQEDESAAKRRRWFRRD